MQALAIVLKVHDGKLYEEFVSGRGEAVLRQILENLPEIDDEYNTLQWLYEIGALHNVSSPNEIILSYEKFFKKRSVRSDMERFKEAISMLGNDIHLD